jgi:EAL domain-containing protein (putative c-di-GMP-specific phosphodiesterase class I)
VSKKPNGTNPFVRLSRRNVRKSAIEQVIDAQEFMVVYQPLVDLQSGEVFAYEALLRSKSPHFSNPLQMFEAALHADCVSELGRVVRELAVENCGDWPLFLNIHPHEFGQGLLVQPNDPIFWHSHPIHVEITESVPLSHFEMCHSVLAEIRGKGVMLAIDDLGAGYSNLKYIADLSPEIVKIDRGLVMEVGSGKRYRQLLSHIVKLCEGMGARVVAEGIETLDELRVVQDAGVDYGQGFLLARPAFPPPSVYWPDEEQTEPAQVEAEPASKVKHSKK